MSTQPTPSPMLEAVDLLRVNINALLPVDLEAHAKHVLVTIAALNAYINSPHPKSANALRNALMLVRKLGLHMARLRDLMQAHQSAMALVAAVPATGVQSLLQITGIPRMGRRSRVIRTTTGADNATSGPLEISGNEPTAQAPEARRGGEAKEGGAHPQSGEASLQAKR